MADGAKKADGEGAPSGVSSLEKAADRIRESAKWLLVSFAAVGATLVAGLQLTSIGELTNDAPEHRLAWAIGGLIVGVVGVVVAIAAASTVVTKSFVTLKWLADQAANDEPRKSIDHDKALLGGYDTVDELQSAYETAMEQRRDKLHAYYQDPTGAGKREQAETAAKWASALGTIQRQVLEQASFSRVRGSYGSARWGILIGALVTAVGIAAFAWAANPPDPAQVPVVTKTPVEVIVRIDPDDRANFESKLGSDCDLARLRAVALRDSGASYDLASVPSKKCKSALFTLAPKQGRVQLAKATSP